MALINISDPGARYTDEEIKLLEEKINSVYLDAQSDIQKKLDDHMAKFQKKDAIYRKKLQDKEINQAEYDAWRKGQIFTGKQWAAKKQEIAAVLNNSNKIATAMINSSAIGVFSENANFLSYSLEHIAGVNFGFGLYNTDSVTKLIKDDPELLPKWKIDQKKDYTWNQQNLNRSLTQGIIQGESLDKISKRVSTNLAGSNKNLMNTFAKTGMTQAQNSGRLTQLERAKRLGLNVKKKWIATLDARTRTAHQELDGQTVDLDKPFKAEGYTIRYPGDPEAHPSLVYNCRCALVGDLVDYPSTYDRYDNIAGKPIKNMTYKEWKKAKAKPTSKPKFKNDPTSKEPEGFADRVEEYIAGGIDIDTVFDKKDIEYIDRNSKLTDKPLYRVEDERFNYDAFMKEGEIQGLGGSFRSFSSDFDFIKRALDEDGDDYAGIMRPVIYEIKGTKTKAFDMKPYEGQYTKNFKSQSEFLVGGEFEPITEREEIIHGKKIKIVTLRQLRD